MSLIPIQDFRFIKPISSLAHLLYLIILFFILLVIVLLPFIKTSISIKTHGITRPQNERTEVKAMISGIIDTLYFTEGMEIVKGDTLLCIKDLSSGVKENRNEFEILQRKKHLQDLTVLTSQIPDENTLPHLESELYIEQLNHFLKQKSEQEILLKKADKEIEINTSLFKEKVISPKEFFDTQNNQEKIQASIKTFIIGQMSKWQQERSLSQREVSQFYEQLNEIVVSKGYYIIKAPVSGIIQGISSRYPGSLLQANETVCTISPEGTIIGECFMQTKDVGLLKPGQDVSFQIDAFDYNYFGILTGKILSIDNDFTAVENKPMFKVRCSFDSTQLHLKNGFLAQLKKGLGFQANFIVAQRSLWQLLFDKIDDWLNPNAPGKPLTVFH